MIKNHSILAIARCGEVTLLFYRGLPPDDLPPRRFTRSPRSPSIGRLNSAVYDALKQHPSHAELSPSLLGLGWVYLERESGQAKSNTTE